MDSENRKPRPVHLPLLVLAGLALIAGIWAGLLRLGLSLPSLGIIPPGAHGPLMIAGFLGTLISLERAVALRQGAQMLPQTDASGDRLKRSDTRIYFLVPLISGLGAIALLVGMPLNVAKILFFISALGFVALNVLLVRRQLETASLSLAAGAILYLVGCALWLSGYQFALVAPWWIAFLVITVAGERLELSRITRPPQYARVAYIIIVGVIITGLILSLFALDVGSRVMGLGFLLLALWLFRFDIARKTVRKPGLTGYIGACLLTGFIWLAVGGLIWIVYGGSSTAGPIYDAMLHVLLLGFVMAMIFGHGPVILPAISGRTISYLPFFYAPLALLHLSLIVRIAGDLLAQPNLRTWGAIGNGVAILLFLLAMAAGTRKSRNEQNAM